jgi:hypothetical protein
MFFEQFSPNIMPFTAFPFGDDTICQILMGQVQLKVIIDEKELIKSFKGKGWDLTLPSREEILKVYDLDDIDKIKEAVLNPKYFPTLTKGRFSYKIPREELLRIETEFYSVKTFVDISEYLINSHFSQPPTRMLATGFVDEALVWK